MTDTGTTAKQTDAEAVDIRMALRKIYVKDISFESPNTPDIFDGRGMADVRPTMKTNVGTSFNARSDDEYEVILRLNVHAVLDDDSSLFLVEVSQGGTFVLPGLSGAVLNETINVRCCRVLFPFAREAVWTLVSRGGLPPLLLQEIDFEALYSQI
ncbi:MAG: protein-export chaperone SecB [Gammaproteobacteria bacterium]